MFSRVITRKQASDPKLAADTQLARASSSQNESIRLRPSLRGSGFTFSLAGIPTFTEGERPDPFGSYPKRRFPLPLQAKLRIGAVDDPLEQEADRVADQVMRTANTATTSAKEVLPAHTRAQLRPPQDYSETRSDAAPSIAGLGVGVPLGQHARDFFESRFGSNFSSVRIHADEPAARMANHIDAKAFTLGSRIVFNSGQYSPETSQGMQLLAHELVHVVQQSPERSETAAPGIPMVSCMRTPTSTIQRKFIATGRSAEFVQLVNQILAVQYRVKISKAGELSIEATDVQGPPTRDAQELLNTLRTVIDDAKTTTMDVIRGSASIRPEDRQVIVGNYALSRIDLDDVEAFGTQSSHSRMGDNAAVQLIHEITEQYRKQVHREGFNVAHAAGYAAQERLLGATLVHETPMTPLGADLGEVTTTYRYPDGRLVDVVVHMNFRTGQIVSVNRNVH